jgi:hypothetical protein
MWCPHCGKENVLPFAMVCKYCGKDMAEPPAIAPVSGEQMEMSMNSRPPSHNLAKGDETVPRRLEWMAGILFIANMFLMYFGMQWLNGEGGWALLTAVVGTGTAVILLLSVALSIFGVTGWARGILTVGLGGLMLSSLAVGIRIIQLVYEHSHW